MFLKSNNINSLYNFGRSFSQVSLNVTGDMVQLVIASLNLQFYLAARLGAPAKNSW